MKSSLLTVAEFARRAGVSKQAVYSRLDKALKPFVQVVDGKKMISDAALYEYYSIDIEQDENKFQSSLNQDSINIEQENKTIELLNKTIEIFKKQLEEKDKQIEQLTAALQAEQQHVTQAQVLHAATIPNAVDGIVEPQKREQEKEKKPSWLRRIFK